MPEERSPVLQAVELNLRDYWRIFRKRRWVVLGVGLVVVGVVYGSARMEARLYDAKSTIRILPRENLGQAFMGQLISGTDELEISSYARVAKSLSVLERVVRELPLVGPETPGPAARDIARDLQGRVSTRIVEAGHALTSLIEIKVTDTEPQRAADIGNKIAEVFIEEDLNDRRRQARQVRLFIEQQLLELQQRLRTAEDALGAYQAREGPAGVALPLQQKLADLESERVRLLQVFTPKYPEIQRLEEQAGGLRTQLARLSVAETELGRLHRAIEVNSALYKNLEERLAGARIAEAERVGNIVLVEPALPNAEPVSPDLRFSLMLGLMLGAFAGTVAALVIEQMDTSIGTIDDVSSLIGAPVIGIIPHISAAQEAAELKGGWRRWLPAVRRPDETRYVRLHAHFHPKSPATEAFRTVRTIIRRNPDHRLLLMTSTLPREGKTTVLINLGVVCAQAGERVLLVALDLRKPQVARTFGLKPAFGISEILEGATTLDRCLLRLPDLVTAGAFRLEELMQTPGLDNLSILPAGQIPRNPAELLTSPRLGTLLKEVRSQFDLVLVDAPPVLPITDALLIAPHADRVLLVYQSGKTARMALARARHQIHDAGGALLGAILNDVHPEAEMDIGYYAYGYRYYGPSKDDKEEKKEDAEKTPQAAAAEVEAAPGPPPAQVG
ncbi:MAG: hypothetical protein A3C53_06630 [Omnitrophica WOR_2 bacterium RIFCSPHIGHO2_02_FULL_68_15]|nr:MAG: hypothetical protein A3C53_06630 [Omnitrophica WOR_2 bacterium RIFCSPHIGHO2_02_FULL_68_15]